MNRMLGMIVSLAERAGDEIMKVYSRDFSVEYKEDSSPLTEADKASHAVIEAGLAALDPSVPIISEEGAPIPWEKRKSYKRFWLVDPLDGTKEFIKRNGEFTVNIALIEGDTPVLGVIYVPVRGVLYYGEKGTGAFRQARGGAPEKLERKLLEPGSPVRAVVSRSHQSAEAEEFLKAYDVSGTVEAGSSLKFCLVAEDKADLYPRFGPTCEWDTAAGHAIAEAAGCSVTTLDAGPLRYNKENPLNPGFVVSGIKKR